MKRLEFRIIEDYTKGVPFTGTPLISMRGKFEMVFFELCTKIAHLFYLSILWLIGCIPIVTIGAATTAYCYMLYKIKANEEGYIARGFINAFRQNFKQSTKVWLILLAAFLILYYDEQFSIILIENYGGMYYALVPVYYVLMVIVVITTLYVFPYMARFEDGTKKIIINSFLMAARHLGYTITTFLLDALVIYLGMRVFAPILFVAPMLIGLINVSMLNVIFKKYEPDSN